MIWIMPFGFGFFAIRQTSERSLSMQSMSEDIVAVGGCTDAISSSGTTPRRWQNIRSVDPGVLSY
jgi:hypothetical protein